MKWGCDYCNKDFHSKSECGKHEKKCKKEKIVINQGIFAGITRITREEQKQLKEEQKKNLKQFWWVILFLILLIVSPIIILFLFG